MKRPACILIATLALLAACHSEKTPDNLIDTTTMKSFLTEAHLIESYAETCSMQRPDSIQGIVESAYDSLYRKYDITPSAIDSSYDYYIRHPQLWEDIYARVTDNLRIIREANIVELTDDEPVAEPYQPVPLGPLDTAALGEARRKTLKAIT